MVRARHDVRDDLGLRRIGNRRLEHADDGRRPVAELHRLADDRRVALERRAPEAMRQHRRARGLRAIIGGVEQPADHGPKAHHAEVRAADDAGADDPRLAETDQREVEGREVAEGRDGRDARAQVAQLRDREVGVLAAPAFRALADVDQPIFVVVDERPQQHAADHAEDGGVGADAERQREDDGDGESLDPGQRPQRELKSVMRLISLSIEGR